MVGATLWAYVVTPSVAHLQGDAFGDRPYGDIRLLPVGLDPLRELSAGLGLGTVLGFLAAVLLGTSAFVAGAVVRWLARRGPTG